MYGGNIATLLGASDPAEVECRQARLQSHQHGKQSCAAPVPLPKGVDQDKLSVHGRKRFRLFLNRIHPTRRVLAQRPSFKLLHQPRHLRGGCEVE